VTRPEVERLAKIGSDILQWFYDHFGGGVVIGLLLLGLPLFLARFMVGATWLQVGCAFGVYFLALFMVLGGGKASAAEAFGFTLILSIFFAWAGVPIAALMLRLLNLPYRFL